MELPRVGKWSGWRKGTSDHAFKPSKEKPAAVQYWPNEDPVGKRIKLDNGAWTTVVGVSPTIRQTNLRQREIEAMVYIPYRQIPLANFRIIARGRSAETLTRALREEVRNVDPDLPLFNITTMREYLNELSRETRILSALFAVFAIIALVLSAVGIYGVSAHSANQRTQEIGVRMALGAGHRNVVWLVLRLGLKQLAIGLPLGILSAFGVSRVLAAALFQVTPWDPVTFVATPLVLILIIICACLVPARRAARLNPVEALRME